MEIIADKAAMSIQKFSPVKVFDWEEERNGRTIQNREFDFLIRIVGNQRIPKLETGKFIEFKWVNHSNLQLLFENRLFEDTTIYDIVRRGLNLV